MWRSLIPAQRLEASPGERGNYWFGPGPLITYWVRRKNLYSVLARCAHEVQPNHGPRAATSPRCCAPSTTPSRRAAHARTVQQRLHHRMYYRDPIDCWTSGRVTLLGDAAHRWCRFSPPGRPEHRGRLDFRAVLRGGTTMCGALLEYERRRLPRTTRIQAGARGRVKLMHEQEAQRLRDRTPLEGHARIDPLARPAGDWRGTIMSSRPSRAAGRGAQRHRLREASAAAPREPARFRTVEIRVPAEDVARAMTGCARPMTGS